MRTLAFVLALSSAAAAQVTGQARYQDRIYDAGGFTGAEPWRPVRQAEVEIVRASDGAALATGVTDDTGAFSVGGIPGNTQVFARVYARRAGGGINAAVRDNPADGAVYAAATPTIASDGSGNGAIPPLDLPIASGAAPPFNIFDAAVKSFEYQASVDADLPALPPPMVIYWEAGTSNGTYFSFASGAIFLLGADWDPDQYDDDIILHEIGHWVTRNFSRDDSPGGIHSISDQLDPRLSWSEGFAHYWSAAVRRAFPAEYAFPSSIVDNAAGGASTFDIEGPSLPDLAVMATNELAVAAVLWDITDIASEGGFDLLSGNEAETWRAVNDRIPARTEITLEDFREGLALEIPSIMADVTGDETTLRIMNARDILYYPNLSEPNESAASAIPIPPGGTGAARRTIYPSGDEDWYSIDLPEGWFRAETLNLGDGADTLLEVYEPDGTTLIQASDNRRPGDRSSLVQAWIAQAGTNYLRVTRSGTVIENGYYDLRAGLFVPEDNVPRAGYCSAAGGAESHPGWIPILALLLLACANGIRGGPRRAVGAPTPGRPGPCRTSRGSGAPGPAGQ